MKKWVILYMVAQVLFLAAIFLDVFFKSTDFFWILAGAAAVFAWFGYKAQKTGNDEVKSTSVDQRKKRFWQMMAGGGLGCIVGFFVLRWQHPDFSLPLLLGVSLLALAMIAGISYWNLFKVKRNQPADPAT